MKTLLGGNGVDPGPSPPNLLSRQISLRPGVVFDGAPYGKNFGDVLKEPDDVYTLGSTVSVPFVAGHPRNDLRHEDSFLTIERLDNGNTWTVIAIDSNVETKFIWKRTNSILGHSQATVVWDIPATTRTGTYRITHSGSHKTMLQQIKPYIGTTQSFKVVPSFQSHKKRRSD
jgi:neutral ceramidase